jgi:hypothetical protein
MDDPVAMHIIYSSKYLLHKSDSFLVFNTFLLNNILKELAAIGILHNEIDVLLSLNYLCWIWQYFIKLYDIGMPQDFQDTDFSCDSFHISLFNYLLLFKDLHSDFLFCCNVSTKLHLSEGTFP